MDPKTYYSAFIGLAILFYFGLGAFTTFVNLPVVKRDAATGACVEVESMYQQFACDELPKKYATVYVAPHMGGN